MGPALGYNCRDLVMTIVVTQGHIVCICLITWTFFFFFFFFIPVHGCSGDLDFPRYWTSLSLSTSLYFLLKCLHLTSSLSLGTETQSVSHMFSSPPAAFTPSSRHWLPLLGCPVSPDFFSFSLCTPWSEVGLPPCALRRTQSLRTQSLFCFGFGANVICGSKANLFLILLWSMHSVFKMLNTLLNT